MNSIDKRIQEILRLITNGGRRRIEGYPSNTSVRYELESLRDDTIIMIHEAVTSPVSGAEVCERIAGYFGGSRSYTHKSRYKFERNLRNIAIFTDVEERNFNSVVDMDAKSRWVLYYRAEHAARMAVVGTHQAFDTEDDRVQMIAVFNAIICMAFSSQAPGHMFNTYSEHGAVAAAINSLHQGAPKATNIVEVFLQHRDAMDQLVPYVVERGAVSPSEVNEILSVSTAVRSGVL